MDSSSNNIHTIVKAQIVFLLSTLTEDNFERNQSEIRSLSEQHGIDVYLHFIRRLIVHSHTRIISNASPQSFDSSSNLTFKLLIQETQRLARDPFFALRFKEAVDKGEGEAFRNFDLRKFTERTGLQPLERFILCTPVLVLATKKELVSQSQSIILHDFDEAVLSLSRQPAFDNGAELSPTQVIRLLTILLSDPPLDAPVLTVNQAQALFVAVGTKYGSETLMSVLRQIVPSISLPKGTTLSRVLIDLGPDITADPESILAVFRRFGHSDSSPPSESAILELFTSLSSAACEGEQLCDISALLKSLSSFSMSFAWPQLIRVLDKPERNGADTNTLKFVVSILLACPTDTNPHPVDAFWSQWNNSLHQIKLLDALVSLPSDTFNFVRVPGRRVVTVDDVAGASPTIKALAANVQGQTWNCLPLFETLMKLVDLGIPEVQVVVREMLEKAVRISSELVHMGLLQVPKPWNDVQRDFASQMLAMFLAGHPNHQLVFMRIWQIDQSYLTQAFIDFYEENQLNITRISDIAQDLKILETLLGVRPFIFALDVAALASRREYLNLDKWLADKITDHGTEFLRAVMDFLDGKTTNEKEARMLEPAVEPRTMALNPQTIAIFLRVLRNNSAALSASEVDYCLEIRNACLQIYPRLMSLIPGSDQEPGFSVTSYSQDIENEVDGVYRQLYEEHISVDQVIAMLQRFKVSKNSREHEIFACMLHFLFDEFRFFSAYPERQLGITAYLFGSLIQFNLVDYIPLGISIRYVLDSLQCPPDTILFKFGLLALARFESRLAEWQPLCQTLLQIPHLQEAHPELIVNIRRMLTESEVSTPAPPAPAPAPAPVPFTTIHPDPLPSDQFTPPSEEVSDKILFIVNNLALSNLDSKVDEMKQRLDDPLIAWFAKYLIDQRVSSEPNNHDLYRKFLEAIDRKLLWKLVEYETLTKSIKMLNDGEVQKSTSERAILKNLGSWFGTITLAKNKPIKFKNLSFKEFLLEGVDTSRLIVAIPFVCKILEGAAKSKVFKPPNPWLMSIVSLLAELYQFADLKLNLKFEIEVLYKALDLDLEKVEPTVLLRSRPPQDALGESLLPEYPPDIGSLPIGGYDPTSVHSDQQLMTMTGANDSEGRRVVGAHIETVLAALINAVTINAQLAPFNNDPSFRRAVQTAVDRTVREIIVPVVERSVTIAGISTRELVSKDFAMEANEEKMRKAAHLMAQKLAGSLALVTCKEPLRNNLGPHIRQFLSDRGFGDQLLSEQVIGILASDNLDAACRAVETAAMERAVVEVDEAFLSQYEMRRRYRETRNGLPFWDTTSASVHAEYISHLPDPLKIKPSGLGYPQFRVYEDFAAFDPKRKAPSRPFSRTDHLNAFSNRAPAAAPAPDPPARNHGPVQISPQEGMERFSGIMNDLEGLLGQIPAVTLSSLPTNSEIRAVVRQPLLLATQCTEREKVALQMSQRIVQYLYKTQISLGREVYVAMLDHLCQSFREVQKEATEWLIYAEDERKYNVPVTVALLRSGLISITQQDQQLARLMWNDPRQSLTDFTANLIRECIFSDPPVAAQSQFPDSVTTLLKASEFGKLSDSATQLLEDLGMLRRQRSQQVGDHRPVEGATKSDSDTLNERLYKWFHQWVNVIQQSASPEKAFIPFVSRVQKEGILKQEELSFLFFRVCTEASVEIFKNSRANESEIAFRGIDALSKLISLIVRYHGDAAANNNDQLKAHYLTKILSIVVVVLAHAHEEQELAFQQKPFFRFFSSLLNDLNGIQGHVGSAYFPLMLALSDTFSSLQPMYFPGFAFSWMSLISHRLYLPKLLMSENRGGWGAFHTLILSMFKFLAFFLKTPDLKHAGSDLYRGASRILLLLLHDFPEFLSEYYFSLCDVIPPNCIQLRNVVLSAFPVNVVLPDPYLPHNQLEALPQMSTIPPVLSDFTSVFQGSNLRSDIDQLLSSRGSSNTSMATLQSKLRVKGGEDYNLSLINSLVMYIGVTSVVQAKARSGSPIFNPSDPGVILFSNLTANLDVEGQHHVLTSMAMHLRYPNAHTSWFSSLLLHLFATSKDEKFQEIITKVLLERFIGHRPHPWGVLVTFIELLRGPKYDFWNREFIRAVPEINLLLESVARSMFPPS